MKTIIIMAIWTFSFAIAAISVCSMGTTFWLSFPVFALSSIYIQRNQKKLICEIDDIFGNDSPFV